MRNKKYFATCQNIARCLEEKHLYDTLRPELNAFPREITVGGENEWWMKYGHSDLHL